MGFASIAGAQPRAVIAKAEPHHHLVFEDATIRVLRVRVPARDSTLLHQHDPDYFWIALGPSTIVNAKLGAPEATVTSADLSIHYTPGKFAHVARNPGATPFDNITIELLKPQSDLRSLCDSVVTGPVHCSRDEKKFVGATEHASFETQQLRVSLLTIGAGKTLEGGGAWRRTWIVALDTLDTKPNAKSLSVESGGKWVGGTFRPSSSGWRLTNHTTHDLRALAILAPE
jgi:hypothetical protein